MVRSIAVVHINQKTFHDNCQALTMQQPTKCKHIKCEVDVMYQQITSKKDHVFMVEWMYLVIVGGLRCSRLRKVISGCWLQLITQNFILISFVLESM
jgi:hypothetical protein